MFFVSIIMLCSLTVISQTPIYASAQPDSNCKVEIRGGASNMSPGELITLHANVNTNSSAQEITWEIDGPVIKDYDDDVLGGAYEVEEPTFLSSEDLHESPISFYWGKANGTNQNRTVNVTVETDNGVCTDSNSYIVAMNTDINKQAEDFFVENKYTGIQRDPRDLPPVLLQHVVWHFFFNFSNPSYNNEGDTFFKFHDIYIKHFNKWRNIFGYEPVKIWDPSTDIESGVDIDHEGRNSTYTKTPMPEWFKLHPKGAVLENRTSNGHPCEKADAPVSPPWPPNQNSLDDFPEDLELLGCAFTDPFHNDVHGAVGGNMSDAGSAPRDPIFWRWHNLANATAEARDNYKVPVVIEGVFGIAPFLQDVTAPRVAHQDPFVIPPFKDDIDRINVTFSEPISGITQNDLLVNDSPAAFINGNGAGPYVFSGFEEPLLGPVNVTLHEGNITDMSGNQFRGESWEYILIDDDDNIDRDGVSQELEVNVFGTNPTLDDTDGDKIIDGIEVSFPCLNPLEDDSHVMTMSGDIINETGKDSDKDGVTNVNEVLDKTDPCSPQASDDMQERSLDDDRMLESIAPVITMDRSATPFTIMIEKTESRAGENNKLMYNSATNKATIVTNGNKTTIPVSNNNELVIQQIVNNSGFFAADSFYPPESNLNYAEFMAFISLGDTFNSVYWTDASTRVPDTIRNLPFVLDEIIGESENTF